MLEISSYTKEIVEILVNILMGVSVFIAFVLGFLIIYASRFLMKRRSREFGLYLVLGMGKRKVSIILFLETLLIGIASLGVGLAAGVVVSQFTSFFVAGMFAADMSRYQFIFSEDACIRTIVCFIIIYVIVILFNTFSINKCKLIDLFQGSRKTESIKLKNPWLCIIVFVAAAGMLGYAYYHVTNGIRGYPDREPGVCLYDTGVYRYLSGVLVTVGTFAQDYFFYEISLLQRAEQFYFPTDEQQGKH